MEKRGEGLLITNPTKRSVRLECACPWSHTAPVFIRFKGRVLEGDGATLQLVTLSERVISEVTMESESIMGDGKGSESRLRLVVSPETRVQIKTIEGVACLQETDRGKFILDSFRKRMLIITPDYPTHENKYLCAFVHSRLQAYTSAGLEFDVACISGKGEVCRYFFEGVAVTRMSVGDLGFLLRNRIFETVVIHFLDRRIARVVESAAISDTRILLWCHGAESLYWDSPEYTTPYFSPRHQIGEKERQRYLDLDAIIRRFDSMPNVGWIFVSDFVRDRSRVLVGVAYERSAVINNFVDGRVFNYVDKDPDLRRKVFFVRKFDDCSNYAIDTAVRCIIELSRRSCFSDMEFSIYGTGKAHKMLVAPLRRFPNVHVYNHYLTHAQIATVHKAHGIALFPTRFDSQGVSMCEAASSGLAVVSTRRDSVAAFLPDGQNLLAETDDFVEYADIIERLYENPDYFKRSALACHDKVASICGYGETIRKEIELLRSIWPLGSKGDGGVSSCGTGVPSSLSSGHLLTIAVPSDALGMAESLRSFCARLSINDIEVIASSSRSAALKEARGRWICFADAADVFEAEGLITLIRRLSECDGSDVLLCRCFQGLPGTPGLVRKGEFDFMCAGVTYLFEDVCKTRYGFGADGPDIDTAVISVERARKIESWFASVDLVDSFSSIFVVLCCDHVSYQPEALWSHEAIFSEVESQAEEDILEFFVRSEELSKHLTGRDISPQKWRYLLDRLVIPAAVLKYREAIEARDAESLRNLDGLLGQEPKIYGDSRITIDIVRFHRKTGYRFLHHPHLVQRACQLYRRIKG